LARAEDGDHDLIALHRAVEEGLAHQGVGRGVLEHPAAGDDRTLDAGAFQQLAPAAGRFRVGDVDRLRVEREPTRAQAGDGNEACAVIDLDEQVLAFLGSHESSSWLNASSEGAARWTPCRAGRGACLLAATT